LCTPGDRREDRVGVEPGVVRRALELERQHVQQDLGVRVRIDVAGSRAGKSSRLSASLFVRLPLCASVMPNGEFT
jgi:hypothetical protein